MKKNTLSVVLAVYNESDVLEKTLNAIKNIADEIVIVDGSSTDNTVEIVKKFKAKVISTSNKQNFHINKNIAIDAATKDWILQLDADEIVSPELAKEIVEKINSNSEFNGYWVNRRNWFLNQFLMKGGQYPDPTIRLYKRGMGRLPEKDVHEQATVEGKTTFLRNDLFHYRDTTFEKYLNGFNRYSSFQAIQLEQKNIQINFLNSLKYFFIKPISIFLSIFIRHRGYIDKTAGFIFALYSSFIPMIAYMKLWQKKYIKK